MSKSDQDRPTAQDYSDLFETDKRGARILEDLLMRFVRPPVTDGGIDAVLKTYERMGQRKPLDFIVSMINRANGVQVEEPTGE
jgi:hypothetical protein